MHIESVEGNFGMIPPKQYLNVKSYCTTIVNSKNINNHQILSIVFQSLHDL